MLQWAAMDTRFVAGTPRVVDELSGFLLGCRGDLHGLLALRRSRFDLHAATLMHVGEDG